MKDENLVRECIACGARGSLLRDVCCRTPDRKHIIETRDETGLDPTRGGAIDPQEDTQPIDHIRPPYYHGDRVMQIIEEFELSFCAGTVVKCLLRHKRKDGVQDLQKAKWYLEREIANYSGRRIKTEK